MGPLCDLIAVEDDVDELERLTFGSTKWPSHYASLLLMRD